MTVRVSSVDERTITVSDLTTLTANEVEQVGKNIANAAQDGYTFHSVSTIEAGSQRDPYITGFTIKLRKG